MICPVAAGLAPDAVSYTHLVGDIRKDGKAMINGNEVAREKLDQAVKLMAENGVDMWVVYSRRKQDPSLELLFNAGLQNEVLFVIAKDGQHVALADESDVAALKDSGLYARVTAVTADTIMGEFKKIYDAADVKKLALNMTAEDDRCDGPVSYTHLDVYKRQGRGTLRFRQQK